MSVDFKISPLTKDKIDSVASLEAACFSVPFTKKALDELFLNTCWHFLVAEVNNTVVGYISFYTIIDETEIVNLCVLPEYRRAGIARALVNGAIDMSRSLGASKLMLEVRASNTGAIKLYEGFGFFPVGVSKNHYSSPTEDAILMNSEL